MNFTSYSKTHQGQVRQLNEDSVHIEARKMQQGGELLVVADGMGGHQSGEVASQQAIATIKEIYYQQVFKNNPPMALKKAIEEANRTIFERAEQENRIGMGTTVVAAVRLGNSLHYAHVGDSRLYLVRNNQIQQVTDDHSLVAEQVAAGILTPEEAENHPHRNVISRAVGTSKTVEVELAPQPIKLQDGDVLILCSDGLTEHVKANRILELIRGRMPKEAAQELINAANAGGGSDNISVIVLRVGKPKSVAAPVRAASPVMAASAQTHAQTGVHTAPPKQGTPRQEKKKGGFALPAALGVVALLLLFVIIGGGTWLLTGNNSEAETAASIAAATTEVAGEADNTDTAPAADNTDTAPAADAADTSEDGGSSENGGSSEPEAQPEGESENSAAIQSTIAPTPTEEATSTVPAGAPTSTRRPTYTPVPTNTPVPTSTPAPPTVTAPPVPPTNTATQTTNRVAASPAVAASATSEESEIAAASVPEATNTPQPRPSNTPVPPPTNTPQPPAESQPPAAETTQAPAPTQAPATQTPATQVPATQVSVPTQAPAPTLAPVATQPPPPPTLSPLPTNTPLPATPASYDTGPNALEPADGASFKSETVIFKWGWDGEALAGGQQFRVMGFRDGEWLNLTTTAANQAQVYMPTFGNFETGWQWYVVVIDSAGNEISPKSATLNFGVSLSEPREVPDDDDGNGAECRPGEDC